MNPSVFRVSTRNTLLPRCQDDPIRSIGEEEQYTDSSHDDGPIKGQYKIGDPIIYTNEDYTNKGSIVDVWNDKETSARQYKVTMDDDTTRTTTRENLRHISEKDPMDFPIRREEFLEVAKQLEPAQLDSVLNPKPLSPLEAEFLKWHHRLNHLSFLGLGR